MADSGGDMYVNMRDIFSDRLGSWWLDPTIHFQMPAACHVAVVWSTSKANSVDQWKTLHVAYWCVY